MVHPSGLLSHGNTYFNGIIFAHFNRMSLGHSSFNFKKPHKFPNLRDNIFRLPLVPCCCDHPSQNDHTSKTTMFSAKMQSFFRTDKGRAKLLICIENAKLKKPRTCSSSKIISKEEHVFQNANFFKILEIKSLAHQKTFFVQSEIMGLSCRYP